MDKGKVIGLVVLGLAVIGGATIYKLMKKPRTNKDGFYNMYGY